MRHRDVLSEVFATLRINGNLYFRARLHGGFAVEVPRERRSIRFHLVREGSCFVQVPGDPAVALGAGALAIIPDGAAQVLSSAPGMEPVPLAEVMAAHPVTDGLLECGEGEVGVSLLCGYCAFDEAVDHPVLKALPRLMVLRPEELADEPWAGAALALLREEAELGAPGMTGVLSRMLEIVFLQAVRRIAFGGGSGPAGFMAALVDAGLSGALCAIHEAPQAAWNVESLAREAGMSRARFAAAFSEKVGVPPIAYLTQWRFMKARALLSGTNLNVDEVAARCGYASGASFSRRFKLEYGLGPGAYRKRSRECPADAA